MSRSMGNRIQAPTLALCLALASIVDAKAASQMPSMTEEIPSKFESQLYTEEKSKNRQANEIFGSAKQSYREFSDRYLVPGFIRSAPLPEIGVLAGPASNRAAFFRVGDTTYFRWYGATEARAGDRYAIYSPKVVLQSIEDPTNFMAKSAGERKPEIPEGYRLAGYLYESNGTIKVVRLNQGMVEAKVESLTAPITLGAHLMPTIPMRSNIRPLHDAGIKLAAAVVLGSPMDRLSTTVRSFIHLNRGSRDGIREGQIFEAVESVPIAVAGSEVETMPGPDTSLGEAMVVYASDSFSTAVITKQFDVIRLGALLKTKESAGNITPKAPFARLTNDQSSVDDLSSLEGISDNGGTIPEVPLLDDLKSSQDPSLPDPMRKSEPQPSPLSELDALEKRVDFGNLTESERKRLGTLSRQEKLDAVEPEEDLSSTPAFSNSFGKPPAKKAEKRKTKAQKTNDEEELNLLMMQN